MAPIDTIDNELIPEVLAAIALQTAQNQIGESEQPKGTNSGPMVNEYLRSVGLSPGYAWCQAFVYWCYATAAKKTGRQNPVVRTAGVQHCWKHTVNSLKLLKADAIKNPEKIRAGDQFILFYAGQTGHTGLVERVERRSDDDKVKWIIHTIEGNSNNTGSREGYEVVRHVRHLDDKALQGFIQYS